MTLESQSGLHSITENADSGEEEIVVIMAGVVVWDRTDEDILSLK